MTEHEETLLLTQKQVDALPIGAKIIVTWSGGNGPSERAITEKFDGHSVTDIGFKNGFLDFVGKEKYHTHVFLSTLLPDGKEANQ